MADFTSNFWNLFVIVITIISILACGVFLYFLSRTKIQVKDGKVETTGHTWDENLQEFNNPLPRWWMCQRQGELWLSVYPISGCYSL